MEKPGAAQRESSLTLIRKQESCVNTFFEFTPLRLRTTERCAIFRREFGRRMVLEFFFSRFNVYISTGPMRTAKGEKAIEKFGAEAYARSLEAVTRDGR
jgi:hypothetical protein